MDLQKISVGEVASILNKEHYLGASRRGFALRDEFGIVILAKPTSRRLPIVWLELVRWCIRSSIPNSGSQQWKKIKQWLLKNTEVTTVISYSDPSVGHTGALYRACNWLWAPTWHRLRPPPSGQGSWKHGKMEAVKDRWIFPVRKDKNREPVLKIHDKSILRRMPWASYREGSGGDFKRWISKK